MPYLQTLAALQHYLAHAPHALVTYSPLPAHIESSLVQINAQWVLLVNQTACAPQARGITTQAELEAQIKAKSKCFAESVKTVKSVAHLTW